MSVGPSTGPDSEEMSRASVRRPERMLKDLLLPWALAILGMSAAWWLYDSTLGRDRFTQENRSTNDTPRQDQRTSTQVDPNVSARLEAVEATLAAAREQLSMLPQRVNDQKEAGARTLASTIGVHTAGRETREQLKRLKAETTTWQVRLDSLLASDDGRRIAANPKFLENFTTVFGRDRPTSERIAAFEQQLDSLLAPVERAFLEKNPSYGVTDEHAQAVSSLGKEIHSLLDSLQQDRLVIDTMLKETQGQPPADSTLEQVLTARNLEEANEQNRRRAEARKAALEEETKSLEKLEQQQVAAEMKVKAQEIRNETTRLEAQATRLKDQGEAESKSFVTTQEKAKLLREFEADLPAINEYLRGCISHGLTQPHGNRMLPTTKKGPVSLAKLKGTGALDDSLTGLKTLAYLLGGFSRSGVNDRDRGAVPKYDPGITGWNNQIQEAYQRAQDFLNKYGQVLVERGMLAE